MKWILYCKACRRALTRAVTMVSGRDPGVVPPELEDMQSPTAGGTVFKSYESYRHALSDPRHLLQYIPQVWMNLADLLGEARFTPKLERRFGCCGLDGCDGPNRICECGEHIGTESSDCWTPRMFIPDPAATQWQNAEGAS